MRTAPMGKDDSRQKDDAEETLQTDTSTFFKKAINNGFFWRRR